MLKNIQEEISRSPVSSLSAAAGVLIGGITLMTAWVQSQNGLPQIPAPTNEANFAYERFNVSNMLLAIAFYLSGAFATAMCTKIIARQHTFAAVCLSIPLAALTNFLTLLVMYLAPPREWNANFIESASELVMYGTAIIFVSFCGQAVVSAIRTPSSSETPAKQDQSGDAIAALFIAGIFLSVWFAMVSFGQTRLTSTFLPSAIQVKEMPKSTNQKSQSAREARSR